MDAHRIDISELRREMQVGFARIDERFARVDGRMDTMQERMEKLLEKLSFEAPDKGKSSLMVDRAMVDEQLGELVKDQDLSRYIL